jgi:hypothetical protein
MLHRIRTHFALKKALRAISPDRARTVLLNADRYRGSILDLMTMSEFSAIRPLWQLMPLDGPRPPLRAALCKVATS